MKNIAEDNFFEKTTMSITHTVLVDIKKTSISHFSLNLGTVSSWQRLVPINRYILYETPPHES